MILDDIETEILQIKSLFLVLNSSLKLFNEHVDCDNREKVFLIYLHDLNTCIGEIRYLQDTSDKWKKSMGDVDYQIFESYRGNGYVGDVLYLMSKYLYENNIAAELFLGINLDNKASIRVAEKIGGTIYFSDDRVCYKRDLSDILDKDKIRK